MWAVAWQNMNFGEGALEEAARRDRQFRTFFQTVQTECRAASEAAEVRATRAVLRHDRTVPFDQWATLSLSFCGDF